MKMPPYLVNPYRLISEMTSDELRRERRGTHESDVRNAIDRELRERQRADDVDRARLEGDEQRDYAEERANAALLEEEANERWSNVPAGALDAEDTPAFT